MWQIQHNRTDASRELETTWQKASLVSHAIHPNILTHLCVNRAENTDSLKRFNMHSIWNPHFITNISSLRIYNMHHHHHTHIYNFNIMFLFKNVTALQSSSVQTIFSKTILKIPLKWLKLKQILENWIFFSFHNLQMKQNS